VPLAYSGKDGSRLKKFKNLVIGGIENKIFNLILVTGILITAAFILVTAHQYRELSSLVAETNSRQQEAITQSTDNLMEQVVNSSLAKTTELEARIAEQMGADYWISFSCRDGKHNGKGEPISECASVLSENHPHLKMIGVNCTKPEYIESLIHCLKSATDLPIAVYPNSGEVYDPSTKTWTHSGDALDFGTYAFRYMAAGASAVGGCCTTVDTHIRQVVQAREKYLGMNRPAPVPRMQS